MTIKQKQCLIFSFILYMIACFGCIKVLDLMQYNLPWTLAYGHTSVWHMYDHSFTDVWAMNYPPIIGLIFYHIHRPVVWAYEHGYLHLAYGLVKLPFVFMHFMIVLYFHHTHHENIFFFWMTNPLWFIVTGLWGQFDEVFCFMIYVLIDMMAHQKYKHLWSLFALMCLFKHQGAYFIFPLCLYTWVIKLDITTKIKGFLCGFSIGIFGWLPFMLLYQDIFYPVQFMLHEMKVNQILSMAVNPWFLMQVVYSNGNETIIQWGWILICLIAILFIFAYWRTKDILLSTSLYMISLFMFSVGQRERYILYSLTLLYYLVFVLQQTRYRKVYQAFYLAAMVSLSYFLINTWLPQDIAYASLYVIFPIYFILAVWLLIQTADMINHVFQQQSLATGDDTEKKT